VRKRRNIGIAVLAALALFVWRFGTFPTGDPIPAVDCPFVSENLDVRVTCFQVPVTTGTVLATVLHRGSRPLEDAPVLMLGPDHAETPSFDLDRYAELELLDSRDIVLVDPLGTARTAPTVDCFREVEASDVEAVLLCRDRLIDAGLLSQWSTDHQVEHLTAVREALAEGRQWRRFHVVARGHGAQLAMRWASTDPSAVATLVLASVSSPDDPSFMARAEAFAPAISALQLECATDGGCNDFVPFDVASERVARRLGTTAEPVEAIRAGERTVLSVDGATFQTTLSHALETPTLPEILPWTVARIDGGASEFGLSDGTRDTLAGLMSATVRPATVDPTMWWHFTCSEEMQLVDPPTLAALWNTVPALVAPADPTVVCGDWPFEAREPVVLDVSRPVLVLESSIDPLATADQVSAAITSIANPLVLRTAQTEWMPGASDCSARALEDFFADPLSMPDSPCLTAPLDMIAHPVPVGTVRQIGGLGETGAMAMGTIAVLATIAIALSIQFARVPGRSSALWRAAAALNAWAFVGGTAVLVSVREPARAIAQPWWSWLFFGAPWVVAVLTVLASAATVQDVRAGLVASRWQARYGLVGIGIAATLTAMILLGIVPGT
jgi:pimeloyl-ACP methyl ester carboxylesterase